MVEVTSSLMHSCLDLYVYSEQSGDSVAEWSKALVGRENKLKPKRSQVRPLAWAILKNVYSV